MIIYKGTEGENRELEKLQMQLYRYMHDMHVAHVEKATVVFSASLFNTHRISLCFSSFIRSENVSPGTAMAQPSIQYIKNKLKSAPVCSYREGKGDVCVTPHWRIADRNTV